MIQTIIGKKLGQTQGFLSDGRRIPMTKINVSGNVVTQIKTTVKDGYEAVQLGFGSNKKATKPVANHAKKAGLEIAPRAFRETKIDKIDSVELGDKVNVEEILSPGDIIDVSGTSKGKGYAGVVKRHHFKGGPKTHGQSDRHRAPGSIGQSTTPGRVYKGKRMAGRMGAEQVTVKNLEVVELSDDVLLVKGLIPGPISSIVTITRRGVNKKYVGIYKEPVAEEVVIDEAKVEEIGPAIEEQEDLRQAKDQESKAEETAEKEAAQIANQDDEKQTVGEIVESTKAEEAVGPEIATTPTLAESMMTVEEKKKEESV